MAKNSQKPSYLVRTKSIIDKEKAVKLCKMDFKKTYVVTTILSIFLFVFGIINLILGCLADKEDGKLLQIIIGSIVALFSIYPFYSMTKTLNQNVKNSIENMGLYSGKIEIEMQFFLKRIEIITTKGDKVEKKTLMVKNIESARKDKDILYLYLNQGKMYVLSEKDVVEGVFLKIINILKSNQVTVKGR